MSVTASNGWRADELSTIDGCGDVDIATRRSDGTLRAARTVRIVLHIGVGIELGEKFLHTRNSQSKTQRLIPVIAGIEIPRSEELRHCYLWYLFPVTENPKLCFARQYLLPPQQAGLSTLTGRTIVFEDFFPELVER